MNEIKSIASLQNPLIKKLVRLKEKSRERKQLGEFVIEGQQEITLARNAGYELIEVILCPEIADSWVAKKFNVPTTHVTKELYEKIAYRGSTEGVLAIAKAQDHALTTLVLDKNPLILVAEAPEKPGNIGALLRTADAAKLDAVIIANPKTDLYNPNIIRSSVGCVFTSPIATATTQEIINFLHDHQIKIYCAALTASRIYSTVNYTEPSAIVVGTEATGLSDAWLANSDQNIIIPMQGQVDSLNVSVSAAILIFEAKRQRDL